MPITINGSGTVSGITGGLTSAAMPSGSALQTVSDVLDTAYNQTTSGGNAYQVTGLQAAITLNDASNKVLVQVSLKTAYSGAYNSLGWWINRVTSGSDNALARGAADGNRTRVTGSTGYYTDSEKHVGDENMVFLDTPGSVGAHTYQIHFKDFSTNGGEFYVNRPRGDSNADNYVRAISSITLTEIKA